MIKKLKKYQSGYFIFQINENLNNKCNAPTNRSGVYLIYNNENSELIYIGRSGRCNNNGSIFIRQGGNKDRLVSGKQFGEARRNSWSRQMNIDKINTLKIHWFVTHNLNYLDCPERIESELLSFYLEKEGKLPKWNNQL